jgi:hypothetical protein
MITLNGTNCRDEIDTLDINLRNYDDSIISEDI